MTIASLLVAYSLLVLLAHLITGAVVVARAHRPSRIREAQPAHSDGVTIIRPVSQADAYLRETLESTFGVLGENIEIIFCAARESDPAVSVVRELLACHAGWNAQLLIGNSGISQNPKLNNCVKGWRAASHDIVALIDSNVLLPPDYFDQMFAAWGHNCGLVTSPPVGARPANIWAGVECAFLNTHQARWQLLADELRMGFAQGKNLLLRKSILEPLGGIASLASEPAEDAAATKVLRAAGYNVRLARRPFPQPLGRRTIGELWRRQVRWAKLRRATFPMAYVPEILAGSLPPLCALITGCALFDVPSFLAGAAYLLVWFGSELRFARLMGWHAKPSAAFAMLVRDLLMPVVWVAGWAGDDFEWQGHQMNVSQDLAEAEVR